MAQPLLFRSAVMGMEREKNKILAVDDEPTFLAALGAVFGKQYDFLGLSGFAHDFLINFITAHRLIL